MTLADLEGRTIQPSGEIHDDASAVIGTLIEGNAKRLSKGAKCDRDGNVILRGRKLGKVDVVETKRPQEKTQELSYPPAPYAPAMPPLPSYLKEQEDISSEEDIPLLVNSEQTVPLGNNKEAAQRQEDESTDQTQNPGDITSSQLLSGDKSKEEGQSIGNSNGSFGGFGEAKKDKAQETVQQSKAKKFGDFNFGFGPGPAVPYSNTANLRSENIEKDASNAIKSSKEDSCSVEASSGNLNNSNITTTTAKPPPIPVVEEVSDKENGETQISSPKPMKTESFKDLLNSIANSDLSDGNLSATATKQKSVKFERPSTTDWRSYPPVFAPDRQEKPSTRSTRSDSVRPASSIAPNQLAAKGPQITTHKSSSIPHFDLGEEESSEGNFEESPYRDRKRLHYVVNSSSMEPNGRRSSSSKISARGAPAPSTIDLPQSNSHKPPSHYDPQNDRRTSYAGYGWPDNTSTFDPYYAVMPYQPHDGYPPQQDYYSYPPSTYTPESTLGRLPTPRDDRIVQLEEKVRAQQQLLQLQELARSKEREEEVLARKRDEEANHEAREKEAEEQRRGRNLEQIERLIQRQNEKSLMMEQRLNARAQAAEEAERAATRELEELKRRAQEAAAYQERALDAAREDAAKAKEEVAKAEQATAEYKRAVNTAREEAERAKETLIAEYTEKLRVESEAKVQAETARSAAERKGRNFEIPPNQHSSTWAQPQYAYPLYPNSDVNHELSSIGSSEGSSEESGSTATETATETAESSEPWPNSGTQSLCRVRVRQDDLDSDPSHKIIFPMRMGWKEHETKTITKSMSRFGFQPLFEEVEAPCVPSQFYEIPGSGGCNLRGTALWQPPGPTLASELYSSFLKCGWKPSYVRTNGKPFCTLYG
jgi:hypothetical protein